MIPARFKSRTSVLLLAVALAGCAYPETASAAAPGYASAYQPELDGYANDWPAQPGAQWGPENVSGIDAFREPLSQYGRWLQSPQWGVVFVPNASNGWRPYQNGQWLENRFWQSADPWGWATDHYGRWGFDQAIGWVWVPDVTWGPSWVAWREADEAVGWAPIPPRVNWSVGVGFGGGFDGGFGGGFGYDDWNSWYAPSWVWVPRRNLYARGFGGRIYPWNSGNNWWGRSHWQHTPYWGWNQPWDRSWGWRAPGRGWNGNNSWNNNRGWNNNRDWNNNRGWNNDRDWNGNNGWNNRGWNNDRRSDDRRWNDGRRDDRRWDNRRGDDPRRGQPGSVGDAIGRDLNGQRQPGWNGNNPPQGGWNRGWNRGQGRPVDAQPGNANNGGNQQPAGGWNGGNRPPRRADADGYGGPGRGGSGWQGGRAPQATVSDSVAGGMANSQQQPRRNWQAQQQAQAQPQPQPQAQPQQSQPQPRAQQRGNDGGGWRGGNQGGNQVRGDGGQPMRGNGQRSSGEGFERPQ